jgi:putative ABC transport system permease protein
MLKNYFRVAFRNMRRNKGFSAINIGGLALGLAICLLILQYVSDELSYDRYNVHADRIYRINNEVKFGGNHLDLAVAPAPTGPAVQRELPGVEQYCRLQWHGSFLIRKGDGNLRESRVAWADSTLFAVFSLPLVQGDPQTALVAPHSLVISETMARKYFNRTDIVGQTLSVNDTEIYRLTAVMKDMPAQSHFRFDFFVSMSGNEDSRNSNWLSENYSTYILLRPQTSASALVPELDQLSDRYIGPELQAIIHENLAEFKKSGAFIRNSLTPLTDIYLHSNKIGELDANGSIETVFIFSAVAIFILVIACVNFMNLSTARSANRAKEVGVRKVLGSQRKSLIAQFLAESFLVSSIALILALVAALLLLPYFNQLAGKQLSWRVLFRPAMLGFLCLLIPGVSLLAGSYPAFYLSAFQPIDVLKGKLAKGFRASRLRNVLVVFQFAISVVLIIGTLVIYNQLHYIRTRDLGFNREQVLVIKGAEALNGRNHAFQNELTQMSGVQTLTMTGFLPVDGLRSNDAFFTSPAMDQQTAISMQKWSVDEQYLSTLGLELTQGRNFSKDFPSDSSGLIINEAAAKFLGGGQLLGKQLYELNGIGPNAGVTISHIVGIVRNFNFNSLREVISPLALRLSENSSRIAVRFQKADLAFPGSWSAL